MSEARHAPPGSVSAAIRPAIRTAIPTWGYHAQEGARLFALAPGARLPAGWADVPHAGQHPHDAERARAPVTAGEGVAKRPVCRHGPAQRRREAARNTGECATPAPRVRGTTGPRKSGRR